MQTQNPHFTMHHRHIACAAFPLLFTLCSSLFLHAQQVPQPEPAATGAATIAVPVVTSATTTATGTTSPSDSEDIVQMSPFEVRSDKDEGYTAINTASGSRLNTPLRDTAASISAFTNEFLNDVGAATIDDMLSYGGNIENEVADTTTGFNTETTGATTNDSGYRIRGMAMTTAMDGINTSYSMDTYNIDRAEISSGPNSILFGMGQPGGMVSLTSKRANLQRNTLRLTNVIGTWQNLGQPWNYYRATLDYNLALLPRTLALRLMGMYQDGNNNSWRYWMTSHDKRINPALSFKPTQTTQINLAYETGQTKNSLTYAWNASDAVTGWLDAGRPIQETFPPANMAATARPPGTNQINGGGSNPDYVFVDNDDTIWDYRQALQSINRYTGNPGQVRLPSDLSSYYYSTVGPGGWRQQKFDSYQAVIEQRIGDLNLQLGYYHNKNDATSHAPPNYDAALRGDPNRYVSTVKWLTGVAGASATENPRAGQLYLEDNWEKRTNYNRNDQIRLMAEYSFNLKNYGRHRLVALFEHSDYEVFSDRFAEILVDENQRAIWTPDTPTPSSGTNYNLLTRRHYVTEGDFRTYYDADWQAPLTPFVLNGHTYHAQYVSRASSANHATRVSNAGSLTALSYWLRGALVTTAGIRMDSSFLKHELESQITDPNDPRLLDGERVWHERVFNGNWNKGRRNNPLTYSYGGVWHIVDRFSLFYNASTNRSADDPSGRTVLPNGDAPPISVGKTQDYGVMFDLLGNNKFFLRITRFNTRQQNQIVNYNANNIIDSSNRLAAIYTALHASGFLLDENAPTYQSVMADAYSRGYDAELTARLSKSFTMRLTFSYTDRARQNIYKEVFGYYNSKIPVWMALADPSKNGNKTIAYIDPSDNSPTTLYQYLLDQLYTTGGPGNIGAAGSSIRDDISTGILQQSGAFASRPLKFTLTARYTIQQGWFKGLAIAPSIRYASPNLMPDPFRLWLSSEQVTPDDHPTTLMMDPGTYTDYHTMIKGASLTFWDLMMNYKYKLFGGRTTMTLQLNIQNMFNDNVVTEGQYRSVGGLAYLRRTYINNPRSIRLTATFDF